MTTLAAMDHSLTIVHNICIDTANSSFKKAVVSAPRHLWPRNNYERAKDRQKATPEDPNIPRLEPTRCLLWSDVA